MYTVWLLIRSNFEKHEVATVATLMSVIIICLQYFVPEACLLVAADSLYPRHLARQWS